MSLYPLGYYVGFTTWDPHGKEHHLPAPICSVAGIEWWLEATRGGALGAPACAQDEQSWRDAELPPSLPSFLPLEALDWHL